MPVALNVRVRALLHNNCMMWRARTRERARAVAFDRYPDFLALTRDFFNSEKTSQVVRRTLGRTEGKKKHFFLFLFYFFVEKSHSKEKDPETTPRPQSFSLVTVLLME